MYSTRVLQEKISKMSLFEAIKNHETFKVLSGIIKSGADVNAKDNNGSTALMIATKHNRSPEILSILTEAAQRSAGNAND